MRGRCQMLLESRGQMAVELAVLMPVVLATALVCVNLLHFAELCARFDRVSLDDVLTQGVSPPGEAGDLGRVEAVRSALADAMGDAACEVSVREEPAGAGEGSSGGGPSGIALSLAAGSVRYVCELAYRPWPTSFGMAGAGFELPVLLRHERCLVVDPYRAGVVT